MVLRDQLREFITGTLMLGLDGKSLDDSHSLMELGILDSVGVLDLVGFLEQTWSITVEDTELVPENLDSVNNLIRFLERKVV